MSTYTTSSGRLSKSPDFYMQSPSIETGEEVYYISQFSSFEKFLNWYGDGKFLIKGKDGKEFQLSAYWMTDGIENPLSDAVEEGYGGWLKKGCEECVDALASSNILDLTKHVDWESIKKGQRPNFRPDIFADVCSQGREAVLNDFKNGWAKSLTQSLINCVRASLCDNHRDATSVNTPGTSAEGIHVQIEDEPRNYRLSGAPDLIVKLRRNVESIMVLSAEVKSKENFGVVNDDISVTSIGQLLGYIIGRVLQELHDMGTCSTTPFLGIYMEESKAVIVKCNVRKKLTGSYQLNMLMTPMGGNIIDILTSEGCRAFLELVHSFICSSECDVSSSGSKRQLESSGDSDSGKRQRLDEDDSVLYTKTECSSSDSSPVPKSSSE